MTSYDIVLIYFKYLTIQYFTCSLYLPNLNLNFTSLFYTFVDFDLFELLSTLENVITVR